MITAIVHSDAESMRLTAPTFYIAGSGEYSDDSTTLTVKGASNLPPGSRLSVTLYDFIGYRSSVLSEDASVVLKQDGFFEVTLKPRRGRKFGHNMVCAISFAPAEPPRDRSVLRVVGRRGELLGIENNPQAGKNSGGYYLQALIHIP